MDTGPSCKCRKARCIKCDKCSNCACVCSRRRKKRRKRSRGSACVPNYAVNSSEDENEENVRLAVLLAKKKEITDLPKLLEVLGMEKSVFNNIPGLNRRQTRKLEDLDLRERNRILNLVKTACRKVCEIVYPNDSESVFNAVVSPQESGVPKVFAENVRTTVKALPKYSVESEAVLAHLRQHRPLIARRLNSVLLVILVLLATRSPHFV